MKFVKITTDARTQYGPFYDGEIRKVENEVGGFLIGNGWAAETEVSPNGEQPAADIPPVTLEVDNANLGVQVEVIDRG